MYALALPLSTVDIIVLNHKAKDSSHTVYVAPSGPCVIDTNNPRPEKTAEAEHFLVNVSLAANELPNVKTTRRKSEDVDFPLWYKEMSAYVTSRYENNKGDAGPWSPIIEVIIT